MVPNREAMIPRGEARMLEKEYEEVDRQLNGLKRLKLLLNKKREVCFFGKLIRMYDKSKCFDSKFKLEIEQTPVYRSDETKILDPLTGQTNSYTQRVYIIFMFKNQF